MNLCQYDRYKWMSVKFKIKWKYLVVIISLTAKNQLCIALRYLKPNKIPLMSSNKMAFWKQSNMHWFWRQVDKRLAQCPQTSLCDRHVFFSLYDLGALCDGAAYLITVLQQEKWPVEIVLKLYVGIFSNLLENHLLQMHLGLWLYELYRIY